MVLVTRELLPPRIHYKTNWSDEWALIDYVEPISASASMPAQDSSSASFRRRYGKISFPGVSQFEIVAPMNIQNAWVRFQINYGTETNPSWETVFIGRIEEVVRQTHGLNTSSDPASGIQIFNAYGPEQLLRKRSIYSSIWQSDIGVTEIGWMPPMNALDERNSIVGNRSVDLVDGTFVYGEDQELWSAKDFVEYLIGHFLNTDSDDDPRWELGGYEQALVDLSNLKRPYRFNESETVIDLLFTVIDRQSGFDWHIGYSGTEDFVIYVSSLAAEDQIFGSKTLHANPNTATFSAVQNNNLESCHLSTSSSQEYGRIRVLGDRVVVCATFERGETSSYVSDGWLLTTEEAYEDGTGDSDDTVDEHDAFRATDSFRDVYQHFHVKFNVDELGAAFFPSVDALGRISFNESAGHQSVIRETLSWLPMQQGFDYSSDPPIDSSGGGTIQPFLPPFVLLQRSDQTGGESPYVVSEHAGVGVSPLPNGWGLQLHAYPNHLIAAGKFTANQPTAVEPEYSYDYLKMTIAFRADERFRLEHPPSNGVLTSSDGVLDIVVPDAQLWVIAPNTVIGLDENGQRVLAPDTGIVVRSDVDQLEQVMTGAIARYYASRNRAVIRVKGLWDWNESLGYILSYVDDNASSENLRAIITQIRWNFEGDHTTELKTGYAL